MRITVTLLYFVVLLSVFRFRCSEVKKQTAGEEKTADIYQCTRNYETNATSALPKLDHNKLKMLLLYGCFFKAENI